MLYHVGDSRHTQNIQINKVIGENEECVSYFTEKNETNFSANTTHPTPSYSSVLFLSRLKYLMTSEFIPVLPSTPLWINFAL